MGSGAKSYMKKRFLIYEEMRKDDLPGHDGDQVADDPLWWVGAHNGHRVVTVSTLAKMTYPAMMAARLQMTHSGELAPTIATEWCWCQH
jgi:hypothetical protein